jgi:thymidylate synthase
LKQYVDFAEYTLENGAEKEDRTGTGIVSIFGYQMRFNLEKGFPLLTTKRIPFRLIASELLWFLKGDTNTQYLLDNDNTIWNEWADEDGNLGRIYGKQWRSWGYYDKDQQGNLSYCEFDQIKEVIKEIKENPNSRRLIVNAWNVGDYRTNKMNLPPCHILFQFNVMNGKLNCQLFQRSCDIFLGCPFNIASYSLLTHMIAQVCDLEVGEFIHSIGDGHIYKNHIQQMKKQILREPKPLPTLVLDKSIKNIDEFTLDHIQLSNYNPYPAIKGTVSI